MRAKLVREIPQREGLPWYFRDYELVCIDCGEHYTSGRYDSRTSPYCGKCKRIHEKEKALERAKQKKQAEINEVLDKIKVEIEEPLKINQGLNTESAKAQAIALSWVLEVIDKYRKGSEEE